MIQPLWITESLTRVFPELFEIYNEMGYEEWDSKYESDGTIDYFYGSNMFFILRWADPQKIHLATLFLRSVDQMRRRDDLPSAHSHDFFFKTKSS